MQKYGLWPHPVKFPPTLTFTFWSHGVKNYSLRTSKFYIFFPSLNKLNILHLICTNPDKSYDIVFWDNVSQMFNKSKKHAANFP